MIYRRLLTVSVPRSSRLRHMLPNRQRHVVNSRKLIILSVHELSLWLMRLQRHLMVFANDSRLSSRHATRISRRRMRRLTPCGNLNRFSRWLSWMNSTTSKPRTIIFELNFERKSKTPPFFLGLLPVSSEAIFVAFSDFDILMYISNLSQSIFNFHYSRPHLPTILTPILVFLLLVVRMVD